MEVLQGLSYNEALIQPKHVDKINTMYVKYGLRWLCTAFNLP